MKLIFANAFHLFHISMNQANANQHLVNKPRTHRLRTETCVSSSSWFALSTLSHVYTPAPSFFGKASPLLQSDFLDLIISQTPVPLMQARDSPRDTRGTSPIPEQQSSASQRQHLACPSAQQAWLASVLQAAGAQSAYHACCQALQGASKALDVGSKQKRGPEGQRRLCPTSFPSCGHEQTGKSETGRTKVGMSPASSGTQWDRLTSQVKVSI